MSDKEKTMRYQVKWNNGDVVRYGIFRSKRGGLAIVDDAVIPIAYKVPDSQLIDIELGPCVCMPGGLGGTIDDEFHRYVDDAYAKAASLSDSLGDGLKVGKMFSLGVGDGQAHYVVTKVGKCNATIEWRGFCPDRYTDQILGWGGVFPRRMIAEQVRRADGFKKIFGRR